MKTLDQVQPRTPISAPTTIESSGSYYLTNDISGEIVIAANNVVLDLNGFTLSDGVPDGVTVSGTNVRVFNGTIRAYQDAGVRGIGVSDTHLHDLKIMGGVNCVSFQAPTGPVEVNRISCKSTTQAGIQVVTGSDDPLIAILHDNIVSFTSSDVKTPRPSIRIGNGGTAGTYVDIRNNRVFASEASCIGVAAGGDDTAGTITGNTTNFCNTGMFVIGEFIVTKNISQNNDTAFDLAGAPNAAPVTDINGSPGPWDNIAAGAPPPK